MGKQSQFILTWDFQEPLPTWHFLIWAWFPGSWIRFLNALQSSVFWGKIAACHSILISMSLIFLAASCNLEPKLLNFLSTATSVAWMVFKFLLKIKHKQYIKTTLRVWLVLTEARKLKVKASHCICTLPPVAAGLPPHLLCCHRPLTYQGNQQTVKTRRAACAGQQVYCKQTYLEQSAPLRWQTFCLGEQGSEDSVWSPVPWEPSTPVSAGDGVRSLNSELAGFVRYKSGP